MVEKEKVDIATGKASRGRWYLLTSLSPQEYGPRELLVAFRGHWQVENSLHHVKEPQLGRRCPHPAPSWNGGGIHHPGQHRAERPTLGRVVSPADVHAPESQDLCLPACPGHRPPFWLTVLTLQSSCPHTLRKYADLGYCDTHPPRAYWGEAVGGHKVSGF